MFHYIKGRITERTDDGIVVETGGIGFEITVPGRSSLYLAGPDEVVRVYTHMAVREDDISLFGFEDRAGLQMFRLLTGVSGIGNKAAMAILSALSVQEIRNSIVFDDPGMFTRAHGIGKKSASRIVLELKDKIDPAATFSADDVSTAGPAADSGNLSAAEDAISALMALGYSRNEAADAIRKAGQDCETAEEYIKQALKRLSLY